LDHGRLVPGEEHILHIPKSSGSNDGSPRGVGGTYFQLKPTLCDISVTHVLMAIGQVYISGAKEEGCYSEHVADAMGSAMEVSVHMLRIWNYGEGHTEAISLDDIVKGSPPSVSLRTRSKQTGFQNDTSVLTKDGNK
jgi:hypothetical protein